MPAQAVLHFAHPRPPRMDGTGYRMVKSELAERIAIRFGLAVKDADNAIAVVLSSIGQALSDGRRAELRGFGSFYVKKRPARMGRNPRSGAPVSVVRKRRIFFRIGKKMHVRLNGAAR